MKVAVFSTKSYDREFLSRANVSWGHDLTFFEARLKESTASLAAGFGAVCVFVNDVLDAPVIKKLAALGVRMVSLRCAGFNNVDLCQAYHSGLRVGRVPAYSPHGVAEHAVALMMALNRRLVRASNRVREGNFSLEGLEGFEIFGKTIGVLGTGKIGECFARILLGFGARVIAFDPYENPGLKAAGVEYLPLPEVIAKSDIISLHLPLTPDTRHLIDARAIEQMKKGVMLINTSRGALVDTSAVIEGLKSGRIGALALDVYEEEGDLFFQDLSNSAIQDDVFARLLTFPNVLITGHQAFFTDTALLNIAETALGNIAAFEKGSLDPKNEVSCDHIDKQRNCGRPCGRPAGSSRS
ncbi:MAG: 2-hydroxyacid dehydrogenase [Elusimicrobia bacterium]|nr:2-hydroxyacid dehydrogenase [Elusimicrobiota bacterium]